MSGTGNRIERISRLVRWRIDDLGYNQKHVSPYFSMGKWDWYISLDRNDVTYGKLIRLKLLSTGTVEKPPIASFITRVAHPAGGCPKAWNHQETTRDKVIELKYDSFWQMDVPSTGKLIVEVEFLDLKIAPPEGGEPCSIWAAGSIQKQWNDSALSTLGRILSENILPDIVINTSNGHIEAHRAILASQSPVFLSMFSHDFKEKEQSTVDMSDMSIEACQAFLNFIYGNMKHEEFFNHRMELLQAADKYVVSGLIEACSDGLLEDIDTENVLDRLQIASMYQLPKLKESCLCYLVRFDKIMDIRDEFDSFLQSADRKLITEIFHKVFDAVNDF